MKQVSWKEQYIKNILKTPFSKKKKKSLNSGKYTFRLKNPHIFDTLCLYVNNFNIYLMIGDLL